MSTELIKHILNNALPTQSCFLEIRCVVEMAVSISTSQRMKII